MCFLWVSNDSYWYSLSEIDPHKHAHNPNKRPRGSNISLFKTSHREELWNTTHRQPRRVLQEALHVATSGKSWLGSREKIFYLEHPRDAARARCARGIYRPYYYAPARIASDILYLKIVLRFNFETLVRTDTSCKPNNNYCLFNFFMSRKIHARSNNRLIKCDSHPVQSTKNVHCIQSTINTTL